MNATLKTASIGPFRGVNNRLPDFALSSEDGDFVRSAVNVDLDDAGRFRRRPGQELVQALTSPHSLFETTDGRFFLVVDAALYRITLPTYSQTLVKVLSTNAETFYVEHNGDVYFSNGTDSGRIASDDAWYPWALPTPNYPAIATIAGGLAPGTYQLALTYSNATTGEEGGAKPALTHELTSTGGIRVTLPGATTGATHVNVYVSACNGDVPCLQTTVLVGTSSVDVTAISTTRACSTIGLSPLPAGTGTFFHMGRLGVIADNCVYFSEPWKAGYYRAFANFIPFPAPVSLVVPSQNGCYIAADQTRWFAGDLANPDSIVDVLPYGAVPGTAFVSVHDTTVGWFGALGVVFASSAGEVVAAMADHISLTPPASGASTVIADNGYRKVVSCGWCVNLATRAATQYDDYAYTSFAGGYGTKADGIYTLSGDEAVDASMGIGRRDFGTLSGKRIPVLRLGVESERPMVLTVSTPDYPGGFSYPARRVKGSLREQTVTPGQGLVATWFDLSLSNKEGEDFILATVNADVALMRRSA